MHTAGIISLVKGDEDAPNEYFPLAAVTAEQHSLLAGVTGGSKVLEP